MEKTVPGGTFAVADNIDKLSRGYSGVTVSGYFVRSVMVLGFQDRVKAILVINSFYAGHSRALLAS